MSIVYELELGLLNINGVRCDVSGMYVSLWRMNVNGQEVLCGQYFSEKFLSLEMGYFVYGFCVLLRFSEDFFKGGCCNYLKLIFSFI